MVQYDPSTRLDREASGEQESEGIDVEQVRETLGFVMNAARRRPKLASITFVTVATLGLTIAAIMPRTYSAQVKLLAQRSSAIHVLSGSTPGMDSIDNPLKNVAATIMRRDNLVALVKEADLADRFDTTRPPALKLKDHILAALFGAPSREDMQKVMVFSLERQLDVATDDPTSTVTITVDWSNPRLAYDLVTLVQKNFLEARYDNDVAMVTDSIGVLEEHAKSELAHLDTELDEYQKTVAERSAKAAEAVTPGPAAPRVPRFSAPSAPSGLPDPDLAKALEEKRLQVRAVEDAHERALESLRQQLVQAQLTLTPMHPQVIALQQRVDAMSQPPPELAQLRAEERALLAQLVPPRASSTNAVVPSGALPLFQASASDAGAAGPSFAFPGTNLDRDGHLQLAQSKLELATHTYEDVLARLDNAKVELDITRTAYKHQYTVVTPAEIPRNPKKATAQIVGVTSVVVAGLLAFLLAAAADLLTGLIIESWQIRRRLGLEILGELDRPS